MKPGVDYIGVSVRALILNDEGKIFWNKRSNKVRSERTCREVPSGAVHFGQRSQKTINREAKEGFGADIEIEIIKTLEATNGILPKNKQYWKTIAFICKIKGNQQSKIMEPKGSDAIGWSSLNNLLNSLSYITQLNINTHGRRVNERK